jgi:hypothetical protein
MRIVDSLWTDSRFAIEEISLPRCYVRSGAVRTAEWSPTLLPGSRSRSSEIL